MLVRTLKFVQCTDDPTHTVHKAFKGGLELQEGVCYTVSWTLDIYSWHPTG